MAKQINSRQFTHILERAINPGSKIVLQDICQNLCVYLELGANECFLDDPRSVVGFEKILVKIIDKHGLDFTGAEAVSDTKQWIGNSSKDLVPEYQKHNNG